MNVAYDGIVFEVLLLESWTREAIYDSAGVDFLYWHHVLRMTCLLNSGATAAANFPPTEASTSTLTVPNAPGPFLSSDAGDFGSIPTVAPGCAFTVDPTDPSTLTEPPRTDLELRLRLAQPGKKLIAWVNSGVLSGEPRAFVMLDSPLPGMSVDCLWGPRCRVNWIQDSIGNSTLVFGGEFETWLPGCSDASVGISVTDPPALLSNRWTTSVHVDPETHLATHVVSGEAMFRKDILAARGVTPDELRPLFMMPPPPMGWRRNPANVALSPGGDSVEYEIVDEELATNFPGGLRYNAISCDVNVENQYEKPFTTTWPF